MPSKARSESWVQAALPQLFALGLGIRALYLSDQSGRIGGQAWAITGVATSAVVVALTVVMNLYGLRS